jgi:hypothetical protein
MGRDKRGSSCILMNKHVTSTNYYDDGKGCIKMTRPILGKISKRI